MATSFTLPTTKFCPISPGTELAKSNKSGSFTAFAINPPPPPGTISEMTPVAIIIPLSIPMLLFTPLKYPI